MNTDPLFLWQIDFNARAKKPLAKEPVVARYLLLVFMSMISIGLNGQNYFWTKLSDSSPKDIRHMPKYGGEEVPAGELEFLERYWQALKRDTLFTHDHRYVSVQMVSLGFVYLRRDEPEAAMVHFNRAYLIDSLNMEVYLGFGGVDIALGHFEAGQHWYREGLQRDTGHFGLLYSMGQSFVGQHLIWAGSMLVDTADQDPVAGIYLDSAMKYLYRAYQIRPEHSGLLYLLSAVYYCRGECDEALRFWKVCGVDCRLIAPLNYPRTIDKDCKRGRFSGVFRRKVKD